MDEPDAARKANSEMTFTPAQKDRDHRLAIEVELGDAGARALSASVVRIPPPSSSGMQDLRVRVFAGDKVTAEYVIPDPRVAEVEGKRRMVLPAGQVTVYAPLAPAPTAIEITPMEGKVTVSRGGRMDLGELAKRACSQSPEVPACRSMDGGQ